MRERVIAASQKNYAKEYVEQEEVTEPLKKNEVVTKAKEPQVTTKRKSPKQTAQTKDGQGKPLIPRKNKLS